MATDIRATENVGVDEPATVAGVHHGRLSLLSDTPTRPLDERSTASIRFVHGSFAELDGYAALGVDDTQERVYLPKPLDQITIYSNYNHAEIWSGDAAHLLHAIDEPSRHPTVQEFWGFAQADCYATIKPFTTPDEWAGQSMPRGAEAAHAALGGLRTDLDRGIPRSLPTDAVASFATRGALELCSDRGVMPISWAYVTGHPEGDPAGANHVPLRTGDWIEVFSPYTGQLIWAGTARFTQVGESKSPVAFSPSHPRRPITPSEPELAAWSYGGYPVAVRPVQK